MTNNVNLELISLVINVVLWGTILIAVGIVGRDLMRKRNRPQSPVFIDLIVIKSLGRTEVFEIRVNDRLVHMKLSFNRALSAQEIGFIFKEAQDHLDEWATFG